MPSAGRTSMPTSGPEPLTSTLDVTLRLAGSIVTIDFPSTRPMIQHAAWAPLAATLDATTAPVNTSTLILANMVSLPCNDPRMPADKRRRRDQLRSGRDRDAGRQQICRRRRSRIREDGL